jgi:transposase
METAIRVGRVSSRPRRRWTMAEKRRIVEQTLSSTRSLASLAREHGVNANQLFSWRKLYRGGQLCDVPLSEPPRSVQLLPVSVTEDEPPAAKPDRNTVVAPHLTMNIEIPGRALVSLEGSIDAKLIRAVLEGLRG